MLFIFSTPELIRHLWQLKTIVFLHQYLICSVPQTNVHNKLERLSLSTHTIMQWVKLEPIQVKQLKCAALQGRLMALPSNIRLGWKDLPGVRKLFTVRIEISQGVSPRPSLMFARKGGACPSGAPQSNLFYPAHKQQRWMEVTRKQTRQLIQELNKSVKKFCRTGPQLLKRLLFDQKLNLD